MKKKLVVKKKPLKNLKNQSQKTPETSQASLTSLQSFQNEPSTTPSPLQSFDEAIKSAGAETPKPKRGRPLGSTKKPEAQAQNINQTSMGPMPQTMPDIPLPVLEQCLKIPFALAVGATKFEGFALTDDEAKENAPLLQEVLKQYLPQVSGGQATLIALSVSLGMSAGVRILAYQDFIADQKKTLEEANKATEKDNPLK